MRTRIPLLCLALASACATPKGAETCQPLSSWAAPAFRCVANTTAPVVEAKPPPEVKPPPKVEVAEEEIKLKERIQFETDSAKLLATSTPVLDEVVTVMKAHPEIERVRIDGHTDSTSTPDHNQKLSDERAAAVRQYLIDHGVDGARLVSKGHGQDKPIADNGTEDGRAQNRRVEIHITQRKK